MKVKLYNKPNYNLTAEQQILYNRGIDLDKQDKWLDASKDELYSWHLLDEKNMVKIAYKVFDCVTNDYPIFLPIDSDMDGFGAGAILTNYLYVRYPEYTKKYVRFCLHSGKQHGLADLMDDIPQDTKMVLVSDAGSNDIKQHNILIDNDIDVCILDHHDISEDLSKSKAIIVNVQNCDYPNKALTGGGVCYKFCQCYDELFFPDNPIAEQFIDLAAIADCGDMADYREPEIRSLVSIGLENLNNPFYKEMAEEHSYSIDKMNGLNYYSCAFYIVPFINAICRSGSAQEKEFVFKGSLLQYANELVESSKRGHKGKMVPWYKEAVLVAKRVKRRQTKLQDEEMEICENQIIENDLNSEPVIWVKLEPDKGYSTLNGLVANKLQAKYQKPSIVTIRHEGSRGVWWQGSMRNYSLSPIEDFKQVINDSGIATSAGHPSAAGLEVDDENSKALVEYFEDVYNNIDLTPIYWVDYTWSENQLDPKRILDIANLNIYGQNIPESNIEIHDIVLSQSMITLMGVEKGHPTLKIQLPNGVSAIKFKSSKEEYEEFCGENTVLNFIAKCEDNFWNNQHSPQLIIEDYKLREEWIF